MTITAYPKAGVGTSEEQWSSYFEQLIETGTTTADGFKATADGSGMTVTVAPGYGFIRGDAWRSSESELLAIDAAPSSGNSRIDTIVAARDLTDTPIINLMVVKGDATTGTPAPKTLTQDIPGTYQWPICDVLVGGGVVAITGAKLTDRRTRTGKNVGIWENDTKPPHADGTVGFNTSTQQLEASIGGSWVTVATGATALGLAVIRAGTRAAARSELGITVQTSATADPTSGNEVGDLLIEW